LKQQIIEASNYDPLLELAWRNFTLYDGHANRLQKGFNNLQVSILTIGIVASALAVSQTQFKEIQLTPTVSIVFHYILIVLPISISVLVAISNRFRSGTKWVLLRAAAEAIKSEIYQYRARSHIYRHKKDESIQSLREKFSSTLEYINNHLMKTDVAIHGFDNHDYTGAIPPEMYGAAGKDDGYSMLSADQYIKIRIGDQLNYYRGRVSKLHKQLKRLHWLILSIGGAGTFLAAAGLQIWIALTTSLGAVFLTFLEYRQVENTIIKYNQTVSELLNIYTWWESLTFRQRDGLAYDIVQCRKQVAKAQDFSDNLQYEYSNKLLERILIDIELNPELRCYRSKVYGLMGSNNFRLGDLQHARWRTELAIRDCESDGDDTGIGIYKENLQIISKKEVDVNTLTQSNS